MTDEGGSAASIQEGVKVRVMFVPGFNRITVDEHLIDGVPNIRGLRIPVAPLVGMMTDGMTEAEVVALYRDPKRDDFTASLRFDAQVESPAPGPAPSSVAVPATPSPAEREKGDT